MTPIYFTHSGYRSYFEGLVQNHIEIQNSGTGSHFFAVNNTQLNPETIKNQQGHIVFVLEYFQLRTKDPKSENKHHIVEGSFSLLMKCEKGNKAMEESIKDTTLRISEEFIARMKEDSLNYVSGTNIFQYQIDEDDVLHYAVGPEYDIMYGYVTEFKLKIPKRGFDPTKWS